MKTNKKKSNATKPMSADLQRRCEKIRGLMNTNNASDVHAKYEIGVEVDGVMKEKKYGKGYVKRIARELGCTTALLYSYAKVADAWTLAEFEAVSKKKNAKGMLLTFTHFVILADVDANERQERMDEALSKSLTARTMARKNTNAPSDGPTHAFRASIAKVLPKVARLLARTKDEPPSSELLAELEGAVERAAEAQKQFDLMMDQVNGRIADMRSKLPAPALSNGVAATAPAAVATDAAAQ